VANSPGFTGTTSRSRDAIEGDPTTCCRFSTIQRTRAAAERALEEPRRDAPRWGSAAPDPRRAVLDGRLHHLSATAFLELPAETRLKLPPPLCPKSAKLLARHGERASLTPFNTSNAMRRAVPVHSSRMQPGLHPASKVNVRRWGFLRERRATRPVELTILDTVPEVSDFLVTAEPV